jgi:hypothetical protein
MENVIDKAAKKAGVPSEVLDLIDRAFLSEVIDDSPDLLLAPIMSTLKQDYMNKGLEWIKQNATPLKEQFLLLQRLYGPRWILA